MVIYYMAESKKNHLQQKKVQLLIDAIGRLPRIHRAENGRGKMSWSRSFEQKCRMPAANDDVLRIQILYVLRKGLPLYSYSGDGIETINPILGRGLDP